MLVNHVEDLTENQSLAIDQGKTRKDFRRRFTGTLSLSLSENPNVRWSLSSVHNLRSLIFFEINLSNVMESMISLVGLLTSPLI